MSKRIKLTAAMALAFVALIGVATPAMARNDAAAEALGWKLGTQAYTFNRFTFFEAVDKAQSVGLKYIELFPGQRISEDIDAQTHHNMNAEQRKAVMDKLKEAGVTPLAYGVVGGGNEDEWKKIFDFAREMGIQNISTEPKFEEMALLDTLANEYGVNVAIHNHPRPSRYWDPATVLEVAEGLSKRIGACADTGHWLRSELDPIESIKKLEGRINTFHFKDLNRAGQGAHDVPWGTGVNDVFATLIEIKRQGFQGLFSIEYEHNWMESLPEIDQSIKYFDLAANALYDKGWSPLLTNDLSNAILEDGGWTFEDGVLTSKGNGDIWTKTRYGNFVLDLEFKCDPQTNSGVFVRTNSIQDWLNTAIEVQILQPETDNPRHANGAIFDVRAPRKQAIKEAGEWNHYVIMAHDNLIFAALNGQQVLDIDLDQWTEAGKNPDGTDNKFRYAYKDMAREGHIGLQYHGNPVWFRNLRIKSLD